MKWIKRILLTLVLIALVLVGGVWAWGAVILARDYSAEVRDVSAANDPGAAERGERVATLAGCYAGCHGRDMAGAVFVETPLLDRIIAPNLSTAAAVFTDAELESIIRQGIRPDGRSVIAMPSASFSSMTDRDFADLLAFLRQYPAGEGGVEGRSRYGLLARGLLAAGIVEPEASRPREQPWRSREGDDGERLGRYLALNACSECHGLDFSGSPDFAPPLTIAKSYSSDDFLRLMATCKGLGDRDLGVMSVVCEHRFKVLQPNEIDALHAFLQTL